jgi:UDP-glucose:(heptosyl)LPS alpha-1,3-glucosyltransferase
MFKRIAIIIERADIALGGAERSMLEVARALVSRGLEVDLLAAKGQPTGGNIHILCADAPGKRVSLGVFGDALRRHLSETHYDVVHSILPVAFADVYQPRGGTYAESVLRNAASYPNRLVRGWKRATAVVNVRRAALLRRERRLCRGSEGPIVAALSRYVADQFQRHYATDPGRIVLTPNGVHIDQHTDPNAASAWRAELLGRLEMEGADRPVLLLFAANNFRLKGLHPLILAMRLASRTRTERPVCLIVVGSGRNSSYRALASSLGVERRILFLGSVQHIRRVLPAIDVGILPTFYDPSSRFILEALGAGKPVITTRFNGAADLFTDNRHGKVVDSPNNIQALADAICHFADPVNIERASQAIAHDNLRANISIDRVANDLVRVYEAVTESRRPRSA